MTTLHEKIEGRPPEPLPAKPFTARSLVGMTESTKKRKAFADWCRMGMRAWPTHAQRWRVGERLRPCPGKHGCVNCTKTCGSCEDQAPDDTKCQRCGSVMTTEGPFCNGSGTVPARKARKARG